MKNLFYFLSILLFCLLSSCQPRPKEMTFTTSSDEALDLFLQGRDFKENIEYARGNELLNQAIELDPDFAMAHLWLNTPENIDRALELISQVTPGENFFIRSFNANSKSDSFSAQAYMDSVLELFPEDKHVLFAAGWIHYQNSDKAMELYNRAIELDENYAPPYNMKGYLHVSMEEKEEAESAFKKYLDLKPESANANDSYGEFLMNTGNYDEAANYFSKAHELDKSFTLGPQKLGWVHIRNGDFDKAREVFNDLYEMLEDNFPKMVAKELIAYAYFVEGDLDKAVESLDQLKGMEISKSNKSPYTDPDNIKGWMHLESGDPSGAVQNFTAALENSALSDLSQEDKDVFSMYGHGNLCLAYSFEGSIEKAENELALAKKIHEGRTNNLGDNTFMNLYEAGIEINRGNYDKAIDLLSLGAGGTSVSSFYYTGLAYDLAGNTEKAVEFYTKANESLQTTFTALFFNKTKKRLEELKMLPI